MSKKGISKGLVMLGSLRKAGVTTYMKQGRVVTRVASSNERRSNTLPQFIQRQKMRHTIALWRTLKYCKTMFTERQTAYQNFASLANRLPVVFVPDIGLMSGASLLMPGIPVSDGKLPAIREQLGEADGMPALLTDLSGAGWDCQSRLLLYTAEQNIEFEMPRVRFSVRDVSWDEMTFVDGRYVLKDNVFADDMKGWALVLVKGERCSPQTIVTRCTLYEQYTTEEALEKAADSYGGLTDAPLFSTREF
ncbi:MAG: hypothetical protein J5630_08395 [Bacteroidaceae bacterium]|nr:hypothetical protein [Bacteroidaceae bacterium]